MGKALQNNVFAINFDKLVSPVPVLQLSKSELKTKAHQFLNEFPGETSYAVKANPHPEIIAEFGKAGIDTFDVASPQEMHLVRSVLPNAKLHYHNPVRTSQETAIALNVFNCYRFSVDHVSGLTKILQHTDQPQGIEIAIRFRLENQNNAVQSFQSKFGVGRSDAIALAHMAREMGFIVGLTFHPGSQTTSPKPYLAHMEEAAIIASNVSGDIAFLNMGGGFPSIYKEMQTSPLSAYFSEIKMSFEELFRGRSVKLECEPGRALVASAGTLVTAVKNARIETGELYLNDGIYGGLMEFYQFPTLQPEFSTDVTTDRTQMMDWTVYGPTCDPADVLPIKLRLPANLCEGDMVKFHGAGAYSTATSTHFNGYGAIEVKFV